LGRGIGEARRLSRAVRQRDFADLSSSGPRLLRDTPSVCRTIETLIALAVVGEFERRAPLAFTADSVERVTEQAIVGATTLVDGQPVERATTEPLERAQGLVDTLGIDTQVSRTGFIERIFDALPYLCTACRQLRTTRATCSRRAYAFDELVLQHLVGSSFVTRVCQEDAADRECNCEPMSHPHHSSSSAKSCK
jgi:hypothetical protein